jgi:hypothetical protein
MWQLWFIHHNPPWEVNGDGNTRYPEDKKSYLHMCRLYNEARQREAEEAKGGGTPGKKQSDREIISTAHRPGFARPELEAQARAQSGTTDPSVPVAVGGQRGVGHIYGPGYRIGRVTKVGKHRKR